VSGVGADLAQAGFFGHAPVEHVGAAGVELAAGRQVDQAGRLAGNRPEPLACRRAVRDGFQQALGVGVMRLVKDVVFGPLLGGPAGVHDHDVVGDVGDHAEVVGDHEQRSMRLLLQLEQQVEDLGLHRGVQRGGGLVGDDHLRRQGHRHGDHGSLAHAAGELVRVVVHALCRVRNADPAQELHGSFGGLFLGYVLFVGPDHLGDLPAHPVQRMQAGQRVLEDDRDPRAADLAHLIFAQLQQVGPAEDSLAGDLGTRGEPEQGLGQDRLAAA
jgi:hypothetical protein